MKYLLSFGHPSWLVALLFFLSGMLFYQFITGLYFVRMGRVTPKRIIELFLNKSEQSSKEQSRWQSRHRESWYGGCENDGREYCSV